MVDLTAAHTIEVHDGRGPELKSAAPPLMAVVSNNPRTPSVCPAPVPTISTVSPNYCRERKYMLPYGLADNSNNHHPIHIKRVYGTSPPFFLSRQFPTPTLEPALTI